MTWHTYIAVTSRGNFYTGVSTDPRRRVYDHNYTKKGAKCLRGQRPIKLVWYKPAESKSDALRLEHQIKHTSRVEKVHLVMIDLLISYEELDQLLWPEGS
jgi:putative endonuclease